MKKWLGRIGLIVLGLFFALALIEILTRIFWKNLSELEHYSSISFVTAEDYEKVEPPKFVWSGRLGNIKEFHVESTRNHLNFHDTEHAFEKPDGTFRIVVLGDSFTEALQVPLDKAFHKVLESKLNKAMDFPVEVISFGISGAGAEEDNKLLRAYGSRYQPDLVIMEFLSNDLIDDSPAMRIENKNQMKLREKYIPRLYDAYHRYLLVKGSRFNQILALKLARLYISRQSSKYSSYDKYGFIHLSTLIFAEEFAEMWEKPWRRTEKFILNTRNLCKENGAEMVLVSFPEFWRLGRIPEIEMKLKAMDSEAMKYRWDFDKTDRVLTGFCHEKKINFLSLLPVFRHEHQQKKKRLHYVYDMHLNEYGHEVAAQAVCDFLIKKHLLQKIKRNHS